MEQSLVEVKHQHLLGGVNGRQRELLIRARKGLVIRQVHLLDGLEYFVGNGDML